MEYQNVTSTLRQSDSSNPLMIQAARLAVERRQALESADAALFAERAGLAPDAWQRDLLRSKPECTGLVQMSFTESFKKTRKTDVTWRCNVTCAVYQPCAVW